MVGEKSRAAHGEHVRGEQGSSVDGPTSNVSTSSSIWCRMSAHCLARPPVFCSAVSALALAARSFLVQLNRPSVICAACLQAAFLWNKGGGGVRGATVIELGATRAKVATTRPETKTTQPPKNVMNTLPRTSDCRRTLRIPLLLNSEASARGCFDQPRLLH